MKSASPDTSLTSRLSTSSHFLPTSKIPFSLLKLFRLRSIGSKSSKHPSGRGWTNNPLTTASILYCAMNDYASMKFQDGVRTVIHTCMMGVLWQILWGGFYRPTARNASPPVDKKPPTKFATERPIIHVCKVETSF